MTNMEYCRFENTHGNLSDCLDALNAIYDGDGKYRDLKLSTTELKFAKKLVMLCQEVVDRVKETLNFDSETDLDQDDVESSITDALNYLKENSDETDKKEL